MTKLYEGLADWWPVISPPSEYAEEAALYVEMIRSTARVPVREVLEIGSGGGNNASHMKHAFDMTLVEPSDGMRNVSRAQPRVYAPPRRHAHRPARARLRRGLRPRRQHVHDDRGRPARSPGDRGGTPRAWRRRARGARRDDRDVSGATEHGGGEDASGRRARYLEWALAPTPGETSYETHYAFLLREPDGKVSAVHDAHREGLFPRATWLRPFGEAGLAAELAPREIEGEEYDSSIAFRGAP